MMVIAPRSRLENTSEDWSSLLASLRELTEWVGDTITITITITMMRIQDMTISKIIQI